MGWVEKFTERILDLGGDVKFEGMKSRELIEKIGTQNWLLLQL